MKKIQGKIRDSLKVLETVVKKHEKISGGKEVVGAKAEVTEYSGNKSLETVQ